MHPFEKVRCVKLLLTTSQGLPFNNDTVVVSIPVISFFKKNLQASQFMVVIVFASIVQ